MPRPTLTVSNVGSRQLAAAADVRQSGTYPSATTYPANGGGTNADLPGPTDYPLQSIPGAGTRLFPGRGTDLVLSVDSATTLNASVI